MSKFTGYEQNIKNNEVFSVQVNLTNSCTSKCQSCRKYEWPQESLSLHPLQDFISELKSKGLQTVVLSGGEPLMYKDLTEFIVWLGKQNLLYSMITTLAVPFPANLIRIAETAERLHVSIDSVDKKEYEKIRGCLLFDDVFKNLKIVQGIRKRENKNPVRVSTTVSKLNYKSVFDIYNKVVKEMNCTLSFYFVHTWEDLLIDDSCKDELLQLFTKIMNDDKDNKTNAEYMALQLLKGNTTSFTKSKTCYLPIHNATIDADGSVYPCCKLLNDNGDYGEQLKYSYGNINQGWSENIMSIIYKMKSIETCTNKVCQNCAQRYDGLLDELTIIHEGVKKPIFL